MLDHFLEVAYKNESAREQSVKLAKSLQHLPVETLQKLASGEVKLSYGAPEDGSSTSWLEKYKDTPLFADAMALEKSDLENEVARSQADAARPQMDHFYQTQDQIRVQKKMLDIKLMETMSAQGMPMPEGGQLTEQITPTAQGAGALGDVAAEGASDGAMTGKSAAAVDLSKAKGLDRLKQLVTGSRAKGLTDSATHQLNKSKKLVEAVEMGSQQGAAHHLRLSGVKDKMIHHAGERAAEGFKEGTKVLGTRLGLAGAAGLGLKAALGDKKDDKKEKSVGEKFKQAAVDLKALTAGAMNVAKKNPALVGGAAGALGGAAMGGEGHRLQGAISGGTLGAGLGAGASAVHKGMAAGSTAGEAVGNLAAKGIDRAGDRMKSIQRDFLAKAGG